MGRAEAGTPKDLDRRTKAKGLTRLRWFCSPCNRPFRDEHGFSLHCKSEAHVRQIMLLGNTNKFIDEQTKQFERNFLETLRISHGEKMVNANAVYQEIIRDKLHVHMNATRHASLTMFVAYLGKEGLCRVEEREEGLFIGYIDRSPAALARQDALRKKEALEMGDEVREQKLLQAQIERARAAAEARGVKRKTEDKSDDDDDDDDGGEGRRKVQLLDGAKITLSFGGGKDKSKTDAGKSKVDADQSSRDVPSEADAPLASEPTPAPPLKPGVDTKMGGKPKARNVFQMAEDEEETEDKDKAAGGAKKMSAAGRIMKEEQERQERQKRFRGDPDGGGPVGAGGGFKFGMPAPRRGGVRR